MSLPTINHVATAVLEVHTNADVTFAVEWWADKARTDPVLLTDLEGGVYDEEALVVDFAAWATIVGNRADVSVPGEEFAAFDLADPSWEVVLVSDTGERKKVARGPVTLFPGGTA